MPKSLHIFSILFLTIFFLPLDNATTVSYMSPNKDKSFCMSPELHEQCGAYCYRTWKPVLEHVVQLTEEIARKDEEIRKQEEDIEQIKNTMLSLGSTLLDDFTKNIQDVSSRYSTNGNPLQGNTL